MRIRKDWYVIYDGTNIVTYGETANRLIETSQIPYAEFETEAEMRDYIVEHNLVEVSDENI